MTAQLLVVLALLELEDELLVALKLLNDGSLNLGLGSLCRISDNLSAVNNRDSGKSNLVACFTFELFDVQAVTGGYLVLLAASLNNSVNNSPYLK